MVVDVFHPGQAGVSKAKIATQLAGTYKADEQNIFLFGFKHAFGGGKSTGFCLIYDTLEDALDVEPKYRLVRAGLLTQVEGSRKQRKELKNRMKKARGKAKTKMMGKKKK